jgi:hypothetical protein
MPETTENNPEFIDDGRNPAWKPGSIELVIWETLRGPDAPPLTAVQMARVRLALDTLHDARVLLSMVDEIESSRDRIAAIAGARAARAAVDRLIADLTKTPGKPGRPRKPVDQRMSNRRYEGEPPNRGRDRHRAFLGYTPGDDLDEFDDYDYEDGE